MVCLQRYEASPDQEIYRLKSLNLRLEKADCIDCFSHPPQSLDVEFFCGFLEKMISLQTLTVSNEDSKPLFLNVQESKNLLRRFVDIVIGQKRKVVLNNAIEIKKPLPPWDEDAKQPEFPTLALTILYQEESVENLKKFLQEYFKNCYITNV